MKSKLKLRVGKTRKLIKNLKHKISSNYQSIKNPPEEKEEQKLAYSLVDLGWDLEKINFEDFQEYDSFFLEKTCVIKQKPLSNAEKYLISFFLKEIQELPFENLESKLTPIFSEFCVEKNIILDTEQRDYLITVIINELFGFGPLSILLNSKEIEEIAVNGTGEHNPVCVYIINKGWYNTNFYFNSESYLKEMINKMARNVGRRITLSSPILTASLKDGSRLNAIIKPVVNSEVSLTIRKFRYRPLTPIDLIKNNTISLDLIVFLALAMQSEINVLIAGNTGSGKTTLLNSLFSFVPLDERIIITEETPEINIPHTHKVALKVNSEQKITMSDLIKTTLRMRPDRVIVGEIRTKEEVEAYIDTILAGQGKGSYATFHGLSVQETVSRLKNLGLNNQDLNALDLIILQKRWTSIKDGQKIEKRRVFEIAEIIDSNVNILYQYDPKTNFWDKVNDSKKVKDKIEIVFGKRYSELYNNLKEYFEFLITNETLNLDEFSKMFNSYLLK